MDRRVKERLVGASILVVLIVLIVPELLPDPAPNPAGPRLPVSTPEPVRNVTVDLATSKAPEPEPAAASSAEAPEAQIGETPSAAAGAGAGATAGTTATSAAPPAGATAAANPQSAAASAPLETEATPPTSLTAAVKPAIAQRGWAVQLGSFASHSNADKLARQLKAQGFSVYVLSGGSGPSLRYRVRIGPMADRGAAIQAAAKLKSSGHVGSLVPPAP